MYSLNIYEDFPKGEFKLLERFYTNADSRGSAKAKALEYAKEKYPDKNVSAMNTN